MSSRDRLLDAAAELLDESADHDVSTRAICERAGVQAPTLYHHFGNKQGLLATVVVEAFTTHLGANTAPDDPVDALRFTWAEHIRFGVERPNIYTYAFGQLRSGEPAGLATVAERALLDRLNEVARHGMLRVAPEVAASRLFAANVGAALARIATPDFDSDGLLDSVLADVLADGPAPVRGGGLTTVAVAFLAALDQDSRELTTGELTLLREWLNRLAATR
jgi:AcrR family transcriptional regulator